MSLIANTRVGLPRFEEKEVWPGITAPVAVATDVYKERGETITKAELKELNWPDEYTEETLKQLIKYGSLVTPEQYKKAAEQDEADAQKLRDREVEIEAEVRERVRAEIAKESEGGGS